MQASLDLANAGITTYLVEKLPSIGGRMSQLDKTFPTLDCSQCILTPKMVDVGRAENIKLMTYTEVEAVEGFIGNFDVTLKKKARGVLSMDEAEAKGIAGGGCNGCGDCEPVCPVIKPNPFEMGMKPRKAIYIYHPQVVPLLLHGGLRHLHQVRALRHRVRREEGHRPGDEGRTRETQGRDRRPRPRVRHLPGREEA